MGPSGRITHVIGYIGYIGSITLFGTGICRFYIWVELPVQRRLCLIFVRNVGSPNIHECFRRLTGSQRTPGFGASHIMHGHRLDEAQMIMLFPPSLSGATQHCLPH